MKPMVWIISGSDSFGAAGAQADLRTTAAHRVHGCQVITAVTAQSPSACERVFPVPAQQISDQIIAIKKAGNPGAVKIGMIGGRENFTTIEAALTGIDAPVVLDPVLAASSGRSLLGDIRPDQLLLLGKQNRLLITPNSKEAEILSGKKITNIKDVPSVADIILEKGAHGVLIKGGHLAGIRENHLAIDYYADRTGLTFFLKSDRLDRQVRGTGCTLASSIASNLALGLDVADAVVLAKSYLNQCIYQAFSTGEDAFCMSFEPPAFDPKFMPAAIMGRSWTIESGDTYRASPTHATGFYVIADSASWIERLSSWNVPTLQLRIKDKRTIPADDIRNAIAKAAETGSNLYINDFWQEAIAGGAFGVHLGQEDLLTADVKAIKDAGLRLGISTHSWLEAALAHNFRPSYIALGPVFPTTCKSMRFSPQGFEKLIQWKDAWPYPVVAIGGLSLEHAEKLRNIGVDGVAVISDIIKSDHPESQVGKWLQAFPSQGQEGMA